MIAVISHIISLGLTVYRQHLSLLSVYPSASGLSTRIRTFFIYRMPFCSFAALSVFFISMVMVIGPAPPGTGVM